MASFTVEWDALGNNLRFQKFSAPTSSRKDFRFRLFNPLTRQLSDLLPLVRTELEFLGCHVFLEMRKR